MFSQHEKAAKLAHYRLLRGFTPPCLSVDDLLRMKFTARIIIWVVALAMTGQAADLITPIAIPTGPQKEGMPDIRPKMSEEKSTIPALPPYVSVLPEQKFEVADFTVEVVKRLQRAMKEARLLEVWSLDPSVSPTQEKEKKSKPYLFHDFHSIGREELKDKDEVQKLLLSVALSIAKGPDEAYECFDPRHGLRIYDQKGFIDVLLCYSCFKGVLYDGKDELWFSTTKDAEAEFDAIFLKLGLRKAE